MSTTTAQPQELTGLAGWASTVMETLGAPGAGALVALENLFPPIPSEVVLPLAGFLAGQGTLDLVAVLVATTLGSVVGAWVLYWVGRGLGRERVARLVERLPLVDVADLEKAEDRFRRHGRSSVLLGRCVPVVRSLVSVPAGVERMPQVQFLLYTTLGSGIWNAVFVLLGFWLGDAWRSIGHYSDVLNYAVLGAVAVAVVVFVVKRLRAARAGLR